MFDRCPAGVAAAAGCLVAASALAQPGLSPVFRLIDPLDTDPGITPVELPNLGDTEPFHVAISAGGPGVNDGPGRGFLFLWLPGSGAAATQYESLAQTASRLGFDVLGLTYDSWPPVNGLTTNSTDPGLPEAIRRERLFGEDATPAIDVDEANSVVNRAAKAIEFLIATSGDERWERYLRENDGRPGGALEWSRVVVGGHSQGSGHAVYLSKEFLLRGSLVFAGPGDFVSGLGTAPWVGEPGVTPTNRLYAFTHVEDPTAAGFFANQRVLGLDTFGPLQNVDTRSPGEIWSHTLVSTLDPGNPNFHSAVAADEFLPVGPQGQNRYEPTWRFMLEAAATGRRPGCNPADSVAPFGVLNATDVNSFVNGFLAGAPRGDLAEPTGIFNATDINTFVNAFIAGCP